MHEYCVTQGWCGGIVDGEPKHVTDFIPAHGMVTADEFVGWLLAAEGIDENVSRYSAWKRKLVPIFIKHMGSYIVDVSKLRSDWHGA